MFVSIICRPCQLAGNFPMLDNEITVAKNSGNFQECYQFVLNWFDTFDGTFSVKIETLVKSPNVGKNRIQTVAVYDFYKMSRLTKKQRENTFKVFHSCLLEYWERENELIESILQ